MDLARKDWFKRTGRAFLRRISDEQPQFLWEIKVERQTLEKLFECLRDCSFSSEEDRACLAVAAVNAAGLGDENEPRFIELFLKNMRVDDERLWNSLFGPSIETFLIRNFGLKPRIGPWRYVRAIYIHAGISARAIPFFSRLLHSLRESFGYHISSKDYEHGLFSTGTIVGFAGSFLRGELGYDFTRDCLHTLEMIDEGVIGHHELNSLTGYPPWFWPNVCQHLSRRTPPPRTAIATIPWPEVALNPDELVLVLRFDPDAVGKGAYRMDGHPVLFPEHSIRDHSTLSGSLHHPSGESTPWEVDPWTPSQTHYALFRRSNGSFVEPGRSIPSGEYFLVIDSTLEIEDSLLHEQLGILDFHYVPGVPYYKILSLLLPPGRTIKELNLEVAGDEPPPVLEFSSAPQLQPYVFFEELPPIRLRGWTERATERYMVLVDTGTGATRVDDQISGDRLALDLTVPVSGRVWIEPRGRMRQFHDTVLSKLSFACVPEPIVFEYPRHTLNETETGVVRLAAPDEATVTFSTLVKPLDARSCEVPARVHVVEGIIDLLSLRIPFNLRIHRYGLRINNDLEPHNVVWVEDLIEETRDVIMEGTPRRACTLQFIEGHNAHPLWTVHLPASGLARFTTFEFRDEIITSGIECAELGIQVEGEQTAPIGLYLLSASYVMKSLERGEPASLPRLPEMQSTLDSIMVVFKRPLHVVPLEFGLKNSPLKSSIADFASAAEFFDNSEILPPVASLRTFVSPEVQNLIDWAKAATTSDLEPAASETLFAEFPGGKEHLVVERWRERVNSILQKVQENSSLADLVGEWRNEIRSSRIRYSSELSQKTGGYCLSEGAKFYKLATGTGDPEFYNRAIGFLQRAVAQSSPSSTVHSLAKLLLQLAFYRSGRIEDAARVGLEDAPPGLGCLQIQIRTLASACRSNEYDRFVCRSAEISISGISPAEVDSALEKRLEKGDCIKEGKKDGA